MIEREVVLAEGTRSEITMNVPCWTDRNTQAHIISALVTEVAMLREEIKKIKDELNTIILR